MKGKSDKKICIQVIYLCHHANCLHPTSNNFIASSSEVRTSQHKWIGSITSGHVQVQSEPLVQATLAKKMTHVLWVGVACTAVEYISKKSIRIAILLEKMPTVQSIGFHWQW